jgi:acyl-coenzyme A synthetase/AMP-(fatty) acid ligase
MHVLANKGTSHVQSLFCRLAADAHKSVIVEREQELSAGTLLDRTAVWIDDLQQRKVSAGDVCAIVGDYGLESISLMLALMHIGAIAMPLTVGAKAELSLLLSIAGARHLIEFHGRASSSIDSLAGLAQNDLVEQFRPNHHPGLIVFTSGSTGQPKGILHDFERVLEKFAIERPGRRTILFLTIDHFGGINTVLGGLAYGGVGICLPDRTPDSVCRSIERGHAELLPTTPTFLKILLASDCCSRYDLSSLQLITYGAEPMAQATLDRLAAVFPMATLKQTYGLSELGVLHSKSADKNSLWLRVGGEGFETRIVDRVLQIRSRSNMVGYLNAPSPIDKDGWMSTGDLVEERDGFIRFLGRISEIINVGAQKVFPAEVENILVEAEGVADATVFGIPHPLLGQAVCARVSLLTKEYEEVAVNRLRAHCQARLAKFKVPMRIEIVQLEAQSTERNKKQRPTGGKVSGS